MGPGGPRGGGGPGPGGPGWGPGPGGLSWGPGPGGPSWGPGPDGPGWSPGPGGPGAFFGGCADGLCNLVSSCFYCLCCCWLFQGCFCGPPPRGPGGPLPF